MKPYPKYLDWLRYSAALLLLTYGLAKVAGVQFTLSPDIASKPIGSLSGYQLTWYYYSYSHVYGTILGLTQITGGILLLFRKTAMLGAAMMVPVMANIVMINIFFFIGYGPQVTSAFILTCVLILLWHDRATLFACFWTSQEAEPATSRRFHRIVAAVIVLFVIASIAYGLFLRSRA